MKPAEELSDVQLKRRRFIAMGILVALAGLLSYSYRVTLRPLRDAAECQSNLKQMGLAMMQYVRDYDEEYPLARNWSDALQPYHRAKNMLYRCPARDDLPFGYAMHAGVAQLSMAELADPKNTILYFDSDAGAPNQTDRGSSLPPSPRHPKGHSIAFNDGHVEFVEVPDMKRGYLDPAESAKRRKERRRQQKERQRQRQESAQRVRRQDHQRFQQMQKQRNRLEKQRLREENLRRRKDLVEARKLSPLKKP